MTGEQLKAARRRSGLSQQAVADYLFVSVGRVARWEAGESEIPGDLKAWLRILLPYERNTLSEKARAS